MRVLGLIPARGGSKGVPRKNIRILSGKPLLQYTAEAALNATYLDRVILSTEDEEISTVGKACGLDVPFLRPSDLAQDTTPTLPVVQHALRWLISHGEVYDAVCLLQPSSPLRSSRMIDICIEIFINTMADCVFTMLPVPKRYNPHWVYFQDKDGYLYLCTGENDPIPNRQSLPSAYHREGSIYVSRTKNILENNSL